MAATLTCLQCGGDLEDGDRFCAACGVESLRCKSCSQPLLPTDFTCPHCGTTAEHAVPAAITPDDGSYDLGDIIGRLRRATLGEFDIGRELGRGGMAAVFLAHEIALDRKVAIKVMAPGLMLGDGMIERFKQEAITVAQLHHPSIVSVYSVRQAEGLHFFVMRYVQGRSLEQVLQEARRLPLPIVRSILYQVGSALTYAHRSRVVHRDVKPANILIDEDGNAVVTDFGIAKAAEHPTQTLTGALVGTPAYMSPEQCAGGEVSGASDQYSLGAVAYEMVTGEPPFAGSTLTVMQAHVERAPRPIRDLCGECPPEVEAAIHRMLAKDPGERWPRMADALTALGAEALPEEHPLRAELSRYVIVAAATLSTTPTPSSPAPRTRASGPLSVASRAVGGISIMPAPAGLEVGDSFTLVAVIRGQHGTRLPPRAVEWTSDAPSVLRVDGPGALATALAPGTAMVTATCKAVAARLRVDVVAPRADDIVIEPMTEPLQAGEEVRLDATARDKHGWPVYRPVNWLSADADVAEVTPHGTIAGRAPGTVRITAALDDARASIVIPVLPPRVAGVDIADPPATIVVGQTVALNATPLDRSNNPLPGRPVLWSTSDASVADVTGEGRMTGVRPGSAVLTATCEGVRTMVRIAPHAAARDTGGGDGPRRRWAVAAGAPRDPGRPRRRGPGGLREWRRSHRHVAARRGGHYPAARPVAPARQRDQPGRGGTERVRAGAPRRRDHLVLQRFDDRAGGPCDRSGPRDQARPGPRRGRERRRAGQRGDLRAPAGRAGARGGLDRHRRAPDAAGRRLPPAPRAGARREGRHPGRRGAHLGLEQLDRRDRRGADRPGPSPRGGPRRHPGPKRQRVVLRRAHRSAGAGDGDPDPRRPADGGAGNPRAARGRERWRQWRAVRRPDLVEQQRFIGGGSGRDDRGSRGTPARIRQDHRHGRRRDGLDPAHCPSTAGTPPGGRRR
jgi:uncharacterized protein YjdB